MKKTRIAFFADILTRDYDGAVRTMYQIIDRLDKNRFEVLFICGEGPADGINHGILIVPNIKIPFNKSYKMALPFLAKGEIQTRLQSFDPDLIHIATPSALGHFALSYGKENNIPVTTIYHTHFESYVEYYLKHFKEFVPLMKRTIVARLSKFYNGCDRVFVPTTAMKESLAGIGIAKDKLILWPRGIDRGMFNPLKKSIPFIRNITNNDKYNILFASRLVWEKNLDTLIRIYRMATFANLPYNFIIAGDGMAREELESQMPKAFFTGALNHQDLSILYASADIFLFPSTSETYGNVVIEAMSSGLPCVIANGGGSASLIHNGHNGYLCAPRNEHDYLVKICRVLTDFHLRTLFKQNGLFFVKDLNWGKLVEKLFLEWEGIVEETKFSLAS